MKNDPIIEAWNTVLFDKFSRFKYLFTEGYASISDQIFEHHQPKTGEHVLDVGCGFGDSTIRLAQYVGPSGSAVGVDCASRFIDECLISASNSGLTNLKFFSGDVACCDLGGEYDEVFSRFGTMFFNMPSIAFRQFFNVLRPGGKFTQVVWRKRQDNPWVYEAEKCVRNIVPVQEHQDTDEVHCGPGPFSLSSADMVSDMLTVVGFERIQFERIDTQICMGRDLTEALQFALELGPAGEIMRLAKEQGEKLKPKVLLALEEIIGQFVTPNGSVWAPASAWVITAHKPAVVLSA